MPGVMRNAGRTGKSPPCTAEGGAVTLPHLNGVRVPRERDEPVLVDTHLQRMKGPAARVGGGRVVICEVGDRATRGWGPHSCQDKKARARHSSSSKIDGWHYHRGRICDPESREGETSPRTSAPRSMLARGRFALVASSNQSHAVGLLQHVAGRRVLYATQRRRLTCWCPRAAVGPSVRGSAVSQPPG